MIPWWLDFLLIAGAHTVSLFNTIALLWLGLTVLLTGDRRQPATIAGGAGLLLGAVFFGGHTLIIAAGSGPAIGVVWQIMWIVAVAAPYLWGLTIFYYSGDPAAGRWVRRVLTLAALGLIAALLVAGPLPSFYEFILASSLKPIVALAYVPYLFLCFTLPLIALRRPRLPDRFRRARPWLLGAASMLALAVIAFAYAAYVVVPRAIPSLFLSYDVVREIFVADVVVAGFIALAIVLLGRAVLANNVLIGRVQSSQGFFARWRNVVLILGLGAFLITMLLYAPIRPIYGLLLTTTLAVVAYAMFHWRQHVEHQAFMDRLRPFVASLNLGDRLLAAGASDSWAEARDLFGALCRDALRAERACLLFDAPLPAPPAGVTGSAIAGPRRIDYNWLPAHDALVAIRDLNPTGWTHLDADHWTWPLSDSRGAIGRLILGPKLHGAEYTAQELQVAAACAERILDALAGEQIARVALSLLRQRVAEVQVMSARHKRALHDDLLPQIHLALLRLEALRRKPADWGATLDEAAAELTRAHQRLSALVREMSTAAPARLESEGLVAALHSALAHDFRDSFDAIDWQVDRLAEEAARRLPLFVGEVVFYAAQEAVRNAARHARGGDPDRKLRLSVAVNGSPRLKIVVSDDGVGRSRTTGETGGAASGLLFHGAMLAVVGGALGVSDRPGGGTQVTIELPQP
jgi:signal transduction histidine kinase